MELLTAPVHAIHHSPMIPDGRFGIDGAFAKRFSNGGRGRSEESR